MSIKGILLDLDNTLYEYDSCNNHAVEKIVEKAVSEFGISNHKAKEVYEKAKHLVKCDNIHLGCSHSRMLYLQKFLEMLDNRTDAKKILEYYELFWNAYFEKMKLNEGVHEFLDEMRKRKIKVAMVTDLTTHIQMKKLVKLGVADKIDWVVSSEEAGKEKPAPYIYLLALHKLNLNKDEVIMIGDHPEKDILGAQNLGIKALLSGDKHFFKKLDINKLVGDGN